MVKVPDASDFPHRAPIQGRGPVPAADGAASGMMTAANLFRRSAEDQAGGVQALGEGLGRAANIMLEASYRNQQRHDAVARANEQITFQDAAEAKFREIQTGGDWSREETLIGYQRFLDEQMQTAITAHGGTEDSRARLTESLLGVRHALAGAAVNANLQAGSAVISSAIARSVNELRIKASVAPQDMASLFVASDARIANFADALTPAEEQAYRDGARGQIAESAITSMLDRGEVDAAERVMLEAPSVAGVLGDAAQSRLTSRIYTIRTQRAAMLAEGFTLNPGDVRFDGAGRPVARVPARPEKETAPTVSNMTAAIMSKVMAGEELTTNDQKALEIASKADPLSRFIAAQLGNTQGTVAPSDEFSPAPEGAPATSAPKVETPQQEIRIPLDQPTEKGEGLDAAQRARLQDALGAIEKGAPSDKVRSRLKNDPKLQLELDRALAIRKRRK